MSITSITSSAQRPISEPQSEARVVDTTRSANGARQADLIETNPPSGTRRYIILYRNTPSPDDQAAWRRIGAKTHEVVDALRAGDGATVVRLTQELTQISWPGPTLSHFLAQQAAGYRILRDFDNMVDAAQRSVAAHRTPTSLHTLALALKNAGRVDEAAKVMGQAAELDPKSVEIGIAHAGYLVLSGDVDGGKAKFATVERKRATSDQYDANAAWFHAITGDFEGMMKRLASLGRSDPQSALRYATAEVDFDRYRGEPRFTTLVAKLERLTA